MHLVRYGFFTDRNFGLCSSHHSKGADSPAALYAKPASKKSRPAPAFPGPRALIVWEDFATLSNLSDCAILIPRAKQLGAALTSAAGQRRVKGTLIGAEARAKQAARQPAGQMMISLSVFLMRLIGGLLVLSVVWFVFDTINDRNTEIIVATLGLLYSFIFMISRRLQYFGLTIFSFFGRTSSYIRHLPYDQILRDEAGIHPSAGRHLYLNVVFAALIEILCLFRLFASLLGRGWEALSAPIHSLLHSAQL
jgi:hypothetical protein